MNTRGAALVSCLVPIFILLEEMTIMLPISFSVFLLFVFREAKVLGVYAYLIATTIGLMTALMFSATNVPLLLYVLFMTYNDCVYVWFIKNDDFNFSNKALAKGSFVSVFPVFLLTIVAVYVIAFDTIISLSMLQQMYTHMIAFGVLLFAFVANQVVYQKLFDTLKKGEMGTIAKRIGVVLEEFMSYEDGLLYLDTEIKECDVLCQ